MMNGRGKSDRPVLPEKSPNKAGQPVAEGMEGRGRAKGNLLQQNASRTPCRTDAPSALERVRQTARRDRKLRFTALLHHIYNLETLRMAYFGIKREAAPGVDGDLERDPVDRRMSRIVFRQRAEFEAYAHCKKYIKKKRDSKRNRGAKN